MGFNKSREFEYEKNDQSITFVLFKDNFCTSCKDVEYILKKLKALGLPVYVINITENTDLIEKYSIEDVPTVIVFRKGRIFDHIVGNHPKKKYLSLLSYFLY